MSNFDISNFSEENEVHADVFEINGQYFIYSKPRIFGRFDDFKLAKRVRNTLKHCKWDINLFLRTDLEFKGKICDFELEENKLIAFKGFREPKRKIKTKPIKKDEVDLKLSFKRSPSDSKIKSNKKSTKTSLTRQRFRIELLKNRANVWDNNKLIGKFRSKDAATAFLHIYNTHGDSLNIFKNHNIFKVRSKYYIFNLQKLSKLSHDVGFYLGSTLSQEQVLEKVSTLNNLYFKQNLRRVKNKIENADFSHQILDYPKTNGNINYIFDYYPEGVNDKISGQIRQYKNNSSQFLFDTFTDDLCEAIVKLSDFTDKKIALVAVPSSDAYTKNSISRSIDRISNENFLNFTDVLTRHTSIPKAHLSGKRNTTEDHYNSIECKTSLSNEYTYILMDDIITTGTTWMACRDILIENGVEEDNIWGLVLGKTVYEDSTESLFKRLQLNVYKYCRDLSLKNSDNIINKASYKFQLPEEIIQEWFNELNWDQAIRELKKQILSYKIIREDI